MSHARLTGARSPFLVPSGTLDFSLMKQANFLATSSWFTQICSMTVDWHLAAAVHLINPSLCFCILPLYHWPSSRVQWQNSLHAFHTERLRQESTLETDRALKNHTILLLNRRKCWITTAHSYLVIDCASILWQSCPMLKMDWDQTQKQSIRMHASAINECQSFL